ncbi:MAG: hypothetical protein WCO35_02605 [Candidatus Nomurabacteria bacterium]
MYNIILFINFIFKGIFPILLSFFVFVLKFLFGNNPECYSLFCINSSIVGVYSVIFAIVIGIIFYVYNEKNDEKREALGDKTKIKDFIVHAITGFLFSFINLPFYYAFNLLILFYLIKKTKDIFNIIGNFNSTNIKADELVKEYKLKLISKKISDFKIQEKRNKDLEEKIIKRGDIYRWIIDSDQKDDYTLYVSNKDGYIENINLNYLEKKVVTDYTNASVQDDFKIKNILKESKLYYLPIGISLGYKIKKGEIVFGIRKEVLSTNFDLGKFITITESQEVFLDYLDKELIDALKLLFIYIKEENYTLIKFELNRVESYMNLAIGDKDVSSTLLDHINEIFIIPLQEAVNKSEDFKTIKSVNSFVLRYLYESFNQLSKQKIYFFSNCLFYSFYLSSDLIDKKTKKDYQDSFCRWIYEISEYLIKSNLNKTRDINKNIYKDSAFYILNKLNDSLIFSYKSKDVMSFTGVINIFNSIYKKDYYNTEIDNELYKDKTAVLFGLTACFLRDIKNISNIEDFEIKDIIFDMILNSSLFYFPVELNELLELAIRTKKLSDNNTLNWDNVSWYDNNGYLGVRSGFVTTETDIVYLLIQILYIRIKDNIITVRDLEDTEILDEYLANNENLKNPLINKYVLNDSDIDIGIITNIKRLQVTIKKNYDKSVKDNLIKQELEKSKIDSFFEGNINGYKESSIMNKISKKDFDKDNVKNNKAKGYNTFFFKERFIKNTNFHFSKQDDERFGSDLAMSENNEILTSILNNKKEIKTIDIKDVVPLLKAKSSDYDFAVIWTKNYLHLEDFTKQDIDFKPAWQLNKEEKQKWLQGVIKNKMKVFSIHPFSDQKDHKDSVIFLNNEDVCLTDFDPIKKDGQGITSIINKTYSLMMSLTNTSEIADEQMETIKRHNNMSDGDIRSKVIFEMYKSSYIDIKNTRLNNIEVYLIDNK